MLDRPREKEIIQRHRAHHARSVGEVDECTRAECVRSDIERVLLRGLAAFDGREGHADPALADCPPLQG